MRPEIGPEIGSENRTQNGIRNWTQNGIQKWDPKLDPKWDPKLDPKWDPKMGPEMGRLDNNEFSDYRNFNYKIPNLTTSKNSGKIF